jgi:hypothetical protein
MFYVEVRDKATPKDIYSAFDQLQPAEKTYYLSEFTYAANQKQLLDYARDTGTTVSSEQASVIGKVVAIYYSNAFEIGETWQGFCKDASRLNHSCQPNAIHTWEAEGEYLIIHALADISKDAEIFTSYVYETFPKAQRDQHLRQYGFSCTCEACRPSIYASISETRRKQLYALHQELNEATSDVKDNAVPKLSADQRIDKLSEMLRIMTSEPGMIGPKAEA